LEEEGLTWAGIDDGQCERLLGEAIDDYAADYGDSALFGSARNKQMLKRINRIMKRAVKTLREQLKQGDFVPALFEADFSEDYGVPPSPETETMSLQGRIDRIDICADDKSDKVLVKVIDYKSGQKSLDLAKLYHGLQLQLFVYLAVAVEMMKKEYPDKEVLPAAALYYRVFDPLIKTNEELEQTVLEKQLLTEQRMTGVVSDDAEIIKHLDKNFTDKSWVIPVGRKKDGTLTSASKVLPPSGFALIFDYLKEKIAEMGCGIKEGDIAVNPYEYRSEHGCAYCDFKNVCGFDARLPGYKTKKLSKMKDDEVLGK
jgi:ATP-dependent helicase/nuclease subunit B